MIHGDSKAAALELRFSSVRDCLVVIMMANSTFSVMIKVYAYTPYDHYGDLNADENLLATELKFPVQGHEHYHRTLIIRLY